MKFWIFKDKIFNTVFGVICEYDFYLSYSEDYQMSN